MRYVFITPWKVAHQSFYYDAIQEYLKRIQKLVPVLHISPINTLDPNDLLSFYAKELKKFSTEKPLCFALDENAKTQSSSEFAKNLEQLEIKGEKTVVFCLGGAYGLPAQLQILSRIEAISLSPMTFPHEMAFTIVLEQIYRARCIISKHPYHHGEKSALAKEMKWISKNR